MTLTTVFLMSIDRARTQRNCWKHRVTNWLMRGPNGLPSGILNPYWIKWALAFVWFSFYARQHICNSAYMQSPVRPSVTRVDQSKTVEDRITKFSPYSSPIPPVFTRTSFIPKFWGVFPRAGVVNESGLGKIGDFRTLAAISPKRCKIGLKLQLVTLSLVPKSMATIDPWPGFQGHGRQNWWFSARL